MADRFQSWNSRQKKFVLFEDGSIKTSSPEKFPGVEVRKDKPGADKSEKKEDSKKKDNEALNDEKPEPKKQEKNQLRGFFQTFYF